MPDRPNILFVMTDQHRGDCIAPDPACPTDRHGDPLVHTPNITRLVQEGAAFSRAYTPAPSCVPARRCLWRGQTPASADATYWNSDPWKWDSTLPSELTAAGYQSWLVGKSHSLPRRNHFGFEHVELHAGLTGRPDDYSRWLEHRSGGEYDEISHGLDRNSWDPRPSHLDEHEHPTNWTTNRAIEFFERRDPTRPFFLYLSYVRPHTPLDPPQAYWDMYIDRDLPDPYMGDWAEEMYGDLLPRFPDPDAWLADLPTEVVHRARAGYYGSITHIDHQLNRVFEALRQHRELDDTLIVFTSDHGEMLGDHYHWRKTYGYEGSARVPFVIRPPTDAEHDRGRIISRPVGLEDVMPTLLGAAGADVPDYVEGRDIFELLEDSDRSDWRAFYHGEHGPSYDPADANHYIVGERMKYVWHPVTGEELLFDLEEDPGEERDLSSDPAHADATRRWRNRLIDHLADRPEGFSDGGSLQRVEPDDAW